MHQAVRRFFVVIAAMGLTAAGVTLGTRLDSPTSARAADLSLQPISQVDLSRLDDGTNHYVVALPTESSAPDAAPPDAWSPQGSIEGTGTTGTTAPALDLPRLEQLEDVVRLDGDGITELVAVLADGRRVPVRLGGHATPAAQSPDSAIDRLRADEATVSVDDTAGGWWAVRSHRSPEDFEVFATALGLDVWEDQPVVQFSDDPYSDVLWGLENRGDRQFNGITAADDVDVDGPEANALSRGSGVIVAVIDSGADPGHPDLPPFWSNADEVCDNGADDDGNGYVDDCTGWDFYNRDNSPFDPGVDNRHGTHVTGTIAAIPDNREGIAGLAPGVTIMNLKALQHGSTWMSAAAEAVRYAVDNGASVINASWGSDTATIEQVPSLVAAVDYALERGVILVAAAGNASRNITTAPSFPASLPQDNVISVGAVMADARQATFSNFSPTDVDLHAPGHYIVSTVPGGYEALQGTSMAAPHVAAAVALVQSVHHDAGIAEVRSTLLSTVDLRPSLTGTSVTGGTLNAAAALGTAAGQTGPLLVTALGLDRIEGRSPTSVEVIGSITDATIAGSRPVVLRATVLTAIDGVDYGVVDLPVEVGGVATRTDDHAQVVLSAPVPVSGLTRGFRQSLRLSLDPGTYAFVFELVDADDPDAAYGPAVAVFTHVPEADPADPGGGSPVTTIPPSSGGQPVSTTVPAPTVVDPVVPSPGAPEPPGTAPVPPGTGDPGPDTTIPVPITTIPPPGSVPKEPVGVPLPPPTTTAPTPVPSPDGGTPQVPTTPSDPIATPPPTVPPLTVVPPTVVGPVTRAGMTLLKVTPNWGPVGGGNVVVVQGERLPANPLVFVGPFPATVVRADPTSLLVEMPPAFPGLFDITVVDEMWNFVTLPWSYRYADARPAPDEPAVVGPGLPTDPYPWDPPSSDPGVSQPGGGLPTTTVPGTDPPTGVAPDPDPGSSPTTVPTTTTLPTPQGRSRLQLDPTPMATSVSGTHLVLNGSPLTADPSTWSDLACNRAACAALPQG